MEKLYEASVFQMPCQLRKLFSFICVFCNPSDPDALWEEFKDLLSEDFARSYSVEDSFNLALASIEGLLKMHNVSLAALGLPQPTRNVEDITLSTAAYDVDFEREREQKK